MINLRPCCFCHKTNLFFAMGKGNEHEPTWMGKDSSDWLASLSLNSKWFWGTCLNRGINETGMWRSWGIHSFVFADIFCWGSFCNVGCFCEVSTCQLDPFKWPARFHRMSLPCLVKKNSHRLWWSVISDLWLKRHKTAEQKRQVHGCIWKWGTPK